MKAKRDLSGLRFGRLIALEYVGNCGRWRCICDCGRTTNPKGFNLYRGITKSCGCLLADIASKKNLTHGHSVDGRPSRTYTSWLGMIARCRDPRHCRFQRYGGRGISICERWNSFANFLADMGERPSNKHSLDRINNDGNYEPGNCRWATASQQSRNRSTSRFVDFEGQSLSMADVAERYGITSSTIRKRLKRGWSIQDAITAPADQHPKGRMKRVSDRLDKHGIPA